MRPRLVKGEIVKENRAEDQSIGERERQSRFANTLMQK
jgi:hypothetical protein